VPEAGEATPHAIAVAHMGTVWVASSSVWAWCLRWSATQEITGPWTAIDPSRANVYSSGLGVRKERWVSRR